MKKIVRGKVSMCYKVFSDGSGMSGIVECFGMKIACQYVGRFKGCNISTGNYSSKNRAMGMQYAKDLFLEVLFEEVNAEWLELNHAMYANEV